MKTFSPLIFSVLFLASFSMDAQKQSSQNAIPLYKVAKIQDCIGSPSAKTFPYIPNFGTSEKPTDESTYWSQQFPLGEDPAIQKWSYQAIPGEGTNLAIYYPGIDMSSVDANPNLYSHCLSLKNSEKYKLSFTIVSTQEASINHLKVWLAPQKGTDGFEQLGILSPTALIGNFNNISKGSLQCVDLLLDKNQIPTDGVYAIAIELLSDMGQGPVYIKEFKVEKFTTADHALGALVAPLSACNLTQSEIIKLRFKNKGLDPVQQLTVYYQVDGATPVKEDFVLPNLVTQQEALLSFKTHANLAKKKTYTLRAWIDKNPNDENQTNDTLKNIFISNTTTSQIPPFSTDFTALEREGWNILAKNFESTNTWTFQGHNGNECATINTASDTVNDWLISPCISLETGKTYRVHFWYKALSNMGEHLQLNMSTNINNPNQGVPIWTGEEFTSILGGEINAEGYMEATTYFTSTQSANYYLGFKAYSKGTRRGISIDKVGMEEMPVGSIPFNQGFEEDKINKDIAIVDVNRDQVTWQIKTDPLAAYNSTKYAEIKGHVAGDGSDGHVGNDWLFTNPVTLEKGKEYRLSYRVSGSEKDSLKIVLVTSYNYKVADTSRNLSWKAIPTGNAYERKTQLFTAPATTAYSVAFKYYGAPNKNATVRLDNILISDPKLVNDTNMILTEVLLPPNAAAGISQEVLTLKYKSLTNEVLEVGNVRFYYQLNDDPLVSMLAPVDIQAYANGSIDFTNNKIDFTKGSIFKIKAWISCHGDKHPENDSLSLTIKVPEPQKIPIKLDFEAGEDLSSWSVAQSDENAQTPWVIDSIVHPDKAYSGKGSLHALSSSKSSNEYFISQSMYFSKDTTYCLRFYYAVGTQGNIKNPNFRIMYNFNRGKDKNSFNIADTLVNMPNMANTTYQNKLQYFKVPTDGKYYLAFHNYSEAGAKDFRLDKMLITDSISAGRTDVQITKLLPPPTEICDLGSNETISIEIQNHGIVEVENIPIRIQFGSKSRSVEEIINLSLAPDTKTRYTLKTPWDFTGLTKDSVRIWINLPTDVNHADDTTAFYVVTRQQEQTTPFFSGFEAKEKFNWSIYDANKDDRSWEKAIGNLSYKGAAYMLYTGASDGSSANDWLLSPCINLSSDSLYMFEFQYRTNTSAREKLQVYLLNSIRPDSLEKARPALFSLDSIENNVYMPFKDSLRVKKSGTYHLAFQITSDYQGQRLLLDDISLKTPPLPPVDTVYDMQLLSIESPIASGILDSTENLSVSIKNASPYKIKNVVLRCDLNGSPLMMDTLKMKANEKLSYTFQKPLNLYTPGEYTIKVSIVLAKDTNLANNSKEIRITSARPDVGIEALIAPVEPPFSSKETVTFKVKNYGQYAISACPVILKMNTMTYKAETPPIEVGQSIEYTFPKTMNMLPNREYSFVIYTKLDKDSIYTNDTLHKVFAKKPISNESISFNAKSIKIYPNPANSQVCVEASTNIESIEILNLEGQIYEKIKPQTQKVFINVAHYPKGNYVMRIQLRGGERVSRSVVVI